MGGLVQGIPGLSSAAANPENRLKGGQKSILSIF